MKIELEGRVVRVNARSLSGKRFQFLAWGADSRGAAQRTVAVLLNSDDGTVTTAEVDDLTFVDWESGS